MALWEEEEYSLRVGPAWMMKQRHAPPGTRCANRPRGRNVPATKGFVDAPAPVAVRAASSAVPHVAAFVAALMDVK